MLSTESESLKRDLDGRMFVKGKGKTERRREVSYSEAVDFVAKHTLWKDPWKFLALHGIKAAPPASEAPGSITGTRPAGQGTDKPTGFHFYNADVDELAGEIPLVGKLLPSLVIAACRQHVTVDQFIADAIREKLGPKTGSSILNQETPPPQIGLETAHSRLEICVPSVVTVIDLLCDAYWDAIDKNKQSQTMRANGLINLACHASSQVETELPLAVDEWQKAVEAAQPHRAAAAA